MWPLHLPPPRRPSPRRRARAHDRPPRPRRQRRRAPARATSCSSPARVPGDRVRAVVGKAKKAYAEARAIEILEPVARARPPVADHPGAPWQVLPYERQLEVKAEQVDDALKRIGQLEDFELEPIVPAARAVALPQQARVLVRRPAPTASSCAASTRPAAGTRSSPMDDCKLASERVNERASRCSRSAASRACGAGTAGPARLPAQPRRPRGPPHRPDAGAPGHLARQARRRRADRRRRRRRPVVDADRRPRREHLTAARRRCSSRRARSSRAAQRPRFLISPEAFFQTNTEMAEKLYGAAAEYAALRGPSASSTSTAASARSGSRSPPAPREVIGLEIVEPAVADAIENARSTRSPTLLLRRRRPPGAARARRAGGQARRRGHRPAARRPLAEDRAPDHRGRARRGSSTSPATRRRSRRTPRSSSRRATTLKPSARSTCSRRPRTSSASRCWSARERRGGSASAASAASSTPTSSRGRRDGADRHDLRRGARR